MRISTLKTTLAAVAGMMLTATKADAKMVKPSTYTNNVVIGKVFYAGAKDANNKNYLNSKYIELYNNSTDTLDLAGMYIGLVESESKANAWTVDKMAAEHKDSLAMKQVFRLPAGAKMDPRTSIIIANSAIDHTPFGTGFCDLSQADYEAKDASGKTENNPNVPALEQVYTAYPTISNMNLVQGGPCAVVLFTEDVDVDALPRTYVSGKTSGNQFVLVPQAKVIDGIDIVKMSEEDIKRMPNAVDSGYVAITAKAGWTGEVVYRKTAYVVGGETVLYDTNDSRRDFAVSTTAQPRQYDAQPAGLTEQTISVPESGYLAINVEQPFFGEKGMVFCYVNATNNAATTDLRYFEFASDSTLLMKGDWIVVATPGDHKIFLSESQGVMRTRSSFQAWTDESKRELTGSQKTRRIYKFTNAKGHVGFQRDETYASVKWNTADFAQDEHLYITLTDAVGSRIFEACGASTYDELAFIPWHGVTPEEVIIAGIEQTAVAKPAASSQIFDLQGRRIARPAKGLYIINGKKVIIK